MAEVKMSFEELRRIQADCTPTASRSVGAAIGAGLGGALGATGFVFGPEVGIPTTILGAAAGAGIGQAQQDGKPVQSCVEKGVENAAIKASRKLMPSL